MYSAYLLRLSHWLLRQQVFQQDRPPLWRHHYSFQIACQKTRKAPVLLTFRHRIDQNSSQIKEQSKVQLVV